MADIKPKTETTPTATAASGQPRVRKPAQATAKKASPSRRKQPASGGGGAEVKKTRRRSKRCRPAWPPMREWTAADEEAHEQAVREFDEAMAADWYLDQLASGEATESDEELSTPTTAAAPASTQSTADQP